MKEAKYSVQVMVPVTAMDRIDHAWERLRALDPHTAIPESRAARVLELTLQGLYGAESKLAMSEAASESAKPSKSRRY